MQFVESAGADLRGDPDPERSMRVDTTHFAESGRMFYEITELSKMRIPTVSVVFGSSTAGGAYQPGTSDYNIFIRNQSKVFLGGPPLVKMATGEDADDEELGGAQMHTEISGLGDYLANDETDAIRLCRDVVSHLNWRKLGPGPSLPADAPIHDPEDLLGMVAKDLRQPLDIREVIGRIVDGSRFEEFKARYGSTLVCGWASVHGFPVGILGNNGALYSESAEKATQFIQLCNQIDVPLLFLQNITGFMVGRDFEHSGIVKNGSLMINAVSQLHGAAHHGDHRGVLRRRQLRHVGSGLQHPLHVPVAHRQDRGHGPEADGRRDVDRASRPRPRRVRANPFDEEADRAAGRLRGALGRAAVARPVRHRAASPTTASSTRVDTRDVIGMSLSACHSNVVQGAPNFGVFRP